MSTGVTVILLGCLCVGLCCYTLPVTENDPDLSQVAEKPNIESINDLGVLLNKIAKM